jgi:hypothetical protein
VTEQGASWNQQDPTADSVPGPADWPALYAQYLLRAAGQSAKSAELYQKIMDRVARGELPPTAVRDQLPTFAQGRGTTYTAKLAELNTQFFTRLVQLNTSYWHDLTALVMPGTATPSIPLPPFDTADPIRWYQQLTEYASQLNGAAVTAYQSLLQQVAAGQVTPSRVQEASSDFLNQRLPEHLRRMSRLYFDLLNGFSDLQASYGEDFLSSVLATAKAADQEMPIAFNLVGPLGGAASASLSLTNTQEQPAIIRCSVTDVRRADGVGPAFAPQVTIAPEALSLRPGEEASVVLSLQLNAADYTPDVLYVGAVHIARRGEPRLDVPLRITATPANGSARQRAAAKSQR